MSDPVAALLALALLMVAVVACQRSAALQPTRGAAAAYLAGTVAWGIAMVAVWVAWAASSEVDLCAEEACESIVESFEEGAAAGEEVMLSQDFLDYQPGLD
jgi:hypothetical protein